MADRGTQSAANTSGTPLERTRIGIGPGRSTAWILKSASEPHDILGQDHVFGQSSTTQLSRRLLHVTRLEILVDPQGHPERNPVPPRVPLDRGFDAPAGPRQPIPIAVR